MSVTKNKVVQFHYKIIDLDGTEIESSFDEQATAYLHGYNNMMTGIEEALEGKQKGDKVEVQLTPDKTFGDVNPQAQQRISVKHLMGAKKWKAGMTAVVNTEEGQRQVTIIKVGKFMATVDTNHPMAGRTLNFELQVEDVRDATQEEIEHGHAHGPGGHHH